MDWIVCSHGLSALLLLMFAGSQKCVFGMSVHRQVNRGPTGDGGLSPEAQQLLVYLAIGSFAAFMLIRVVYMMLYSLPLVGVLLFFTKPSLYGFRDFLAIVEKKKDGEQEADDPISGGTSGGNWLTSLVTKSIKGIKGAIFNPAHRWLYVDLLVIIVARKRQPKVGGGSGRKKYAIGVLQRWFLLEESSELPMLSYAYGLVDLLLGWLNDEQWASFAALPPPPAGSADAAAVPSIDPSRLINAANEIIGGEIDAMAQMIGTAQARAAEGDAGRRMGGSERPIQMFLDRAQAFAEAGNFERAGQSVEAGISRCRGSLKGSKGEEEGELWLVAAAFYEASGTQLSAVVKCLRQAADLCVAHGKWRDAARLFVRATEVWIKEKVADRWG